MKRLPWFAKRYQQAGFSLLEIMIAIALIGLGMLSMLQMSARRETSDATGFYKNYFMDSAAIFESFVSVNRSTFEEILSSSSVSDTIRSYCVGFMNSSSPPSPGNSSGATGSNGILWWSPSNGSKPITCAFDLSLVKYYGFAPSSMKEQVTNPFNYVNERPVAVVRIAPSAAAQGTSDIELLVIPVVAQATDITPASQVNMKEQSFHIGALQNGGDASIGWIPIGALGACTFDAGTNNQVCGMGWSHNLAEWVDNAYLNQVKSRIFN